MSNNKADFLECEMCGYEYVDPTLSEEELQDKELKHKEK